jgi:hypothetical protein
MMSEARSDMTEVRTAKSQVQTLHARYQTSAGFLLVAVGFVGGALASVLHEETVRWGWFVPAVVAGMVGVAIMWTGRRREVRAVGRLNTNLQAIDESLRRVVANILRLNEDKHTLDPYDVRHRLEELFADDLNTIIEARDSIAHFHGLPAYGDVMNSFTAGERYLNRVWSASADGYVDEVNTYLDRAAEQFSASLDKLQGLQNRK